MAGTTPARYTLACRGRQRLILGLNGCINGTPSLRNKSGQLEPFGRLLYTLGSKKEHAPLVPAFTNEKARIAVSYRTNGIADTYYKGLLRIGSFQSGTDLTSDKIKGLGAALLTDQR